MNGTCAWSSGSTVHCAEPVCTVQQPLCTVQKGSTGCLFGTIEMWALGKPLCSDMPCLLSSTVAVLNIEYVTYHLGR
jgi:hypothetical protein